VRLLRVSPSNLVMRYAWGRREQTGPDDIPRARSFITVSLRWESSCHVLLSHTCNFLTVLYAAPFTIPPAFSAGARDIAAADIRKARRGTGRSARPAVRAVLRSFRESETVNLGTGEAGGNVGVGRDGGMFGPYYLNRAIFPHMDACNVTAKVRTEERTNGRTDSVSERSQGEPERAAPVITIEGYFLTALMMRSDDAYLAYNLIGSSPW
jgi:hypothetical protein